jgi:hypothetical protein
MVGRARTGCRLDRWGSHLGGGGSAAPVGQLDAMARLDARGQCPRVCAAVYFDSQPSNDLAPPVSISSDVRPR